MTAAKRRRSTPRLLERTVPFEGRIFRVEQDRVRLPTGRTATFDVVRHRGSVVLIAQPTSRSVVLIDWLLTLAGAGGLRFSIRLLSDRRLEASGAAGQVKPVLVIGAGTAGTVVLRELNITCLPTAIPESIVVDVSELAIGDVITVADIVAPEGVSIVHEADEAVVTVTPPQTEADAETDEVGEGEGDETAGGEE